MLLVGSLAQLSSFLQDRKTQGRDFTMLTGIGNPFYIATFLHDFLVGMESDESAVAMASKLRNLVTPNEKGEPMPEKFLLADYSRGDLIDNPDYAYDDVYNLIDECSRLLNTVSPKGMYFGGNDGCSTDLGWFFKHSDEDAEGEEPIRIECDMTSLSFGTETNTGDGSTMIPFPNADGRTVRILGTVTGRVTSDKSNYEPIE